MKSRILLTGGSSGIGKSCHELLKDQYLIDLPSRLEFDLTNLDHIDNWDYSVYDIVINCAGCNHGTYLGFQDNTSLDQTQQIQVNFIAPLLMIKNYTRSRQSGQFIYISSSSIDNPFAYNVVNSTAKAALRYSIDVLQKEFKHIYFNEICPGKTKTNMLNQNYKNTRSIEDLELEYDRSPYLLPQEVAALVQQCIWNKKISKINIQPQ
jgi:short-subunit dehydrogenase